MNIHVTYHGLRLRRIVALVICGAILMGCKEEGKKSASGNLKLVSHKKEFSLTARQLQDSLAKYPELAALLPKAQAPYYAGVDVYTLVCKTTYIDGKTIEASGVVALPTRAAELYKVVSFQHGTAETNAEAPSVAIKAGQPFNMHHTTAIAIGLAAYGLAVVAPDYIGYGSSDQVVHPYYVERLTATSVADMTAATLELIAQSGLKLTLPAKVQLAGYSEGGYATLAAHKYIEQEKPKDIDLLGSFPAAGGYDIKQVQELLFTLEQYSSPIYIGFIAIAYREAFHFQQILTDMFQEPYASRMPSLFDGAHSVDEINAQLTVNIKELLTPEVLSGLDKEDKYKYLADAFRNNSPVNWSPTLPVRLYHGAADSTVPYANSESALAKLKQGGSTATTLTQLQGDHTTAFAPYLEEVVPQLITGARGN